MDVWNRIGHSILEPHILVVVVQGALFPMKLARQEGLFLVHSRLAAAFFMAHSALRSRTSPKMDDNASGTQCRSTLRMRRFSLIRRMSLARASFDLGSITILDRALRESISG